MLKLSPLGAVLLVLGRINTGAEANWLFNKPADVAFAKNGDIYVADGYGNSRVVKFDRDGNFLKAWGKYGASIGEFNLPHTVAVDQQERVYVGDRENQRIQIFDGDGKFIKQWTGSDIPTAWSSRLISTFGWPMVVTTVSWNWTRTARFSEHSANPVISQGRWPGLTFLPLGETRLSMLPMF